MWNIDVEKNLGTEEVPKPSRPMIKVKRWNADLAYGRLKIVRDVKDHLSEGINSNSLEIPEMVAQKYEKIYQELESVERMEIETVKYGR